MSEIAREGGIDNTLALLRDPYRFIVKRCRRQRADVFETRLLLKKTICLSGPEAAALFYDEDHFIRHGAAPRRLKKTLFGDGGVQTLDGNTHRHRKGMLMSLMTPAHIARFIDIANRKWRGYATRWAPRESVELYGEAQRFLMQTVCQWANIPLRETEVDKRTAEVVALFDGAGAVGPKHWLSRTSRKHSEEWLTQVIEKTRAGRITPHVGTALHTIAWHREENGQLLEPHVAAVELLNIVRPTVAVSVYIVFIAHALHQYPQWRAALKATYEINAPYEGKGVNENKAAQENKRAHESTDKNQQLPACFVQEVRRFYPFFPVAVARTRHAFSWKGYSFARDERVMLDLYGTNHDERSWYAPNEFRPKRFLGETISAYNFIPQGGGDFHLNHRCPGEWLTIELMKNALHFLVTQINYNVPAQDLSIDYSRLPALPKSRFIIDRVLPLFR